MKNNIYKFSQPRRVQLLGAIHSGDTYVLSGSTCKGKSVLPMQVAIAAIESQKYENNITNPKTHKL